VVASSARNRESVWPLDVVIALPIDVLRQLTAVPAAAEAAANRVTTGASTIELITVKRIWLPFVDVFLTSPTTSVPPLRIASIVIGVPWNDAWAVRGYASGSREASSKVVADSGCAIRHRVMRSAGTTSGSERRAHASCPSSGPRIA